MIRVEHFNFSSIRDNHDHGTVGQFLKDKIKNESELSIVSAFFTIYARELSDPSHPVSVAMAKMQEIEEVKIIEGRG